MRSCPAEVSNVAAFSGQRMVDLRKLLVPSGVLGKVGQFMGENVWLPRACRRLGPEPLNLGPHGASVAGKRHPIIAVVSWEARPSTRKPGWSDMHICEHGAGFLSICDPEQKSVTVPQSLLMIANNSFTGQTTSGTRTARTNLKPRWLRCSMQRSFLHKGAKPSTCPPVPPSNYFLRHARRSSRISGCCTTFNVRGTW